jgi:hypothetical protein
MTATDFVLKIKNASQNISANFLVKGISTINVIFNERLMIIYMYLTFLLSKILGLPTQHPPLPLPPYGLSRGWGNSGSLNSIAAALVVAQKQ